MPNTQVARIIVGSLACLMALSVMADQSNRCVRNDAHDSHRYQRLVPYVMWAGTPYQHLMAPVK